MQFETLARTEGADIDKSYETLASFFEQHCTQTLELDIVSSLPVPIQQDGNALAIRPRELARVYLVAHHCLFHQPSASLKASGVHEPGKTSDPSESHLIVSHSAYSQETPVMLFFASEHLLAANARKRYLQDHILGHGLSRDDYSAAVALLRRELCLLDSFVTSPLPKHTKSSNLWSHRFWVIRSFLNLHVLETYNNMIGEEGRETNEKEILEQKGWPPTLRDELQVVLRAGDRHFANYIAFDYARQVYRILGQSTAVRQIVEMVMRWCFAHPRDVSGWSFLDFSLRQEGISASLKEEVRTASERFVSDTGTWNGSIAWFARTRDWKTMRKDTSDR